MDQPMKKAPRRRADRIILQFDYDCFYAQVFENRQPALKSLPLGVRQKNILATCNYNARSRGVRKLMLASEAKKLCPDLVLVDGEDLTPFRDMSKTLFNFFRSHSWNAKVERLGFDEVFMDITDIVEYNMSCLNKTSLAQSFFYLSKTDPLAGFACNLTEIPGCIVGSASSSLDWDDPAVLRHSLGAHLAQYLRLKIEEDFGYTSTCGISTNKVLSKLVGSKNKPRNQTTLLGQTDDAVLAFMDRHTLRSIPGVGFKTAKLLEAHVTSKETNDDSHSFESTVTAQQVRLDPTVTPGFLEKILGGAGAERGIGARIWGLLHGVDPTDVKEASDIPSQISIEDTYKGLETVGQITEELHKLSNSLIRRMRIDLVVQDDQADEADAQKWIARPKTLRLSIRSWPQAGSNASMNYARASRSGPLPNFMLDLKTNIRSLAERLVIESLLPLLRRLEHEKGSKWNLQLINICAANMVVGAASDKTGAGRDIASMFKHQDEALRPWTVTPVSDSDNVGGSEDSEDEGDAPTPSSWDDGESPRCQICGCCVPSFAQPAHTRYHELGEEVS